MTRGRRCPYQLLAHRQACGNGFLGIVLYEWRRVASVPAANAAGTMAAILPDPPSLGRRDVKGMPFQNTPGFTLTVQKSGCGSVA